LLPFLKQNVYRWTAQFPERNTQTKREIVTHLLQSFARLPPSDAGFTPEQLAAKMTISGADLISI
jgi:hypothetical protein